MCLRFVLLVRRQIVCIADVARGNDALGARHAVFPAICGSQQLIVQRSLSVCCTMFGAYFFAAVIVGVFFAVSALHIPGIAAYAVTTAFLLLASVLMHLLLVHWGAKKFERLEA